MKNYFKVIQWVAALTAACILVFQLYWVYRTYSTSRQNFSIQLQYALQQSVDLYLLERIETPVSLTGPAPSLSILNTLEQNKPGGTPEAVEPPFKGTGPVRIKFQPIKIDTANLESVRLFVARMIALSDKQKIELPVVSNYFKSQLASQGIDVGFTLSLHKNPEQKGHITASLGRGKGDWVIEAHITREGRYLINQNMLPALVSLFLIILTGGCLWYMGVTISRQRQLDRTKNDFIDNLTHELRTPIAILKSANEALLQFGEAANPEKTQRYLNINAGVLRKLENDVDRLLAIRQYDLGAKKVAVTAVNLPEVINNVIAKFNMAEGAQVMFESGLEQQTVLTDRYMVEDILANLVDNALKYTNGPAGVLVKANNMASGWQLVVEDNGLGISKENLPFIFDKFYRISTGDVHDVKGYGIGLSYVKQLVLLLGGSITVNSTVGKGTIFIINFPA